MRRKKSINVVLAEALKHYMGDHWTPYSLAKKSGVAEGTIRNYLAPEKRQPSASGKEPSAKLTRGHQGRHSGRIPVASAGP